MKTRLVTCFLIAALFFPAGPQGAEPAVSSAKVIQAALNAVQLAPEGAVQYDYVMTARVRLLLFWASKDDVGGGYIRRGRSKEDPRKEFFQVLFGSDPVKAPRNINRWGAGTEISMHRSAEPQPGAGDVESSAFFGFMKSSKGKSVSEMQEELKKEKDHGQHMFTGILSTVERNQADSLVVPLPSDIDFNFGQYNQAEPLMIDRLRYADKPVRQLSTVGGCNNAGEFLTTVSGLVDAALAGRPAPLSRCYVYDAQVNTLTLEHTAPLHELSVRVNGAHGASILEKSYRDLLEADFVSEHELTKKKVHFTIVLGTIGSGRGVPVQIRYQPNWWFQVVLNLKPTDTISASK